jgi:hypothetical protein
MRTFLGGPCARAAIRPVTLTGFVLGFFLGACGTSAGEATPSVSVDTPAPTTATTAAAAVATEPATSPPPSPLTVVAIGDSFVASSSWPKLYASEVESTLGRPTELDVSLARAGGGPRLPAVRDSDRARSKISEADILIIQPQPGFAASPPMRAYLDGTCGGDHNTDCFTTAAADYRTYLEEYLDLIASLTGDETPIRVITTGTWGMDAFHPRLRAEDPAKLDDLIGLVDMLMAVVESEAEERSIPVIDVNTAFNGPDHRQLAPDDYLIVDRLHLADAGSAVVVQLLVEAGFAPLDGEIG